MHTVAIIQVRMGSTRLPGKCMMDLDGEPMVGHVYRRARKIVGVDSVVVAYPMTEENEPLMKFCVSRRIPCFSGNEHDVLNRFYWCARHNRADVIVRITGDCPLLSPGESSKVVLSFLGKIASGRDIHYLSNTHPVRVAAKGEDTECFTWFALQEAWKNARDQYSREHVTPYMKQHLICGKMNYLNPNHEENFSVDTQEDFENVHRILNQLKEGDGED